MVKVMVIPVKYRYRCQAAGFPLSYIVNQCADPLMRSEQVAIRLLLFLIGDRCRRASFRHATRALRLEQKRFRLRLRRSSLSLAISLFSDDHLTVQEALFSNHSLFPK